MKNIQAPNQPQSSSAAKSRTFFAAAALATLLITSSCTTSQQVAYSSDTTQARVHTSSDLASANSGWHLVSDHPVKYFPIGLSKDAETDYRHGDWVRAGKDGTLWFIPVHGVAGRSEQDLRKEALAMATRSQKMNRALDNALDGASSLVGAAAEAYSFFAGGEGPEEIITEMNHR